MVTAQGGEGASVLSTGEAANDGDTAMRDTPLESGNNAYLALRLAM